MFDRRQLLKSAALAAPLLAAPGLIAGHAYAAPAAGQARLLVVFLRGAYDAANIVAPTSSDFYHTARPSIALARPDPANPDAALPLDAEWSLHPALKDSILPLWGAKQIAFVPFAGTDDLSRSHFETQDTIELGQPIVGSRNYNSGFMARLAAVLGTNALAGSLGASRLSGDPDRPISFTDQLPLVFRGGPVIPNIAISGGGVGKSPLDDRQAKLIEAMYRGGGLASAVNEGFATHEAVYKSIQDEMVQAGRGAVSAKGFELAARRIGHLMRDQYNLAFVDVGGWDTHVNQGGAQGQLAGRIGELGRALAGFADEIGADAWRNTTVVVISEFGRTFRENGDKGTDHGHGSVYWVLGGNVRGGRIAGPQVAIAPETLNENRDLPVLTDYRALIGGIAGRLYGLSPAQLAVVFPGVRPVDLQLV